MKASIETEKALGLEELLRAEIIRAHHERIESIVPSDGRGIDSFAVC